MYRTPDGKDLIDLSEEEKIQYVETAFHILAPKLAKMLIMQNTNIKQEVKQQEVNEQIPFILTIKEASNVLDCSAWKLYELVKQNKFPVIRIGNKIKIKRDALYDWINKGGMSEK